MNLLSFFEGRWWRGKENKIARTLEKAEQATTRTSWVRATNKQLGRADSGPQQAALRGDVAKTLTKTTAQAGHPGAFKSSAQCDIKQKQTQEPNAPLPSPWTWFFSRPSCLFHHKGLQMPFSHFQVLKTISQGRNLRSLSHKIYERRVLLFLLSFWWGGGGVCAGVEDERSRQTCCNNRMNRMTEHHDCWELTDQSRIPLTLELWAGSF